MELEVEEYIIQCWHCLGEYDAVSSVWCSCDAKNPTKLCPYCLQCFCEASDEYKESFWKYAPKSLLSEREALRSSKEKLGEILLRAQLLSTEQLLFTLAHQTQTGKRLGELFVELNFISQEELEYFLSLQNQPPPDTLNPEVINFPAVDVLTPQFCIARKVLPILTPKKIGNRNFQPVAMAKRNDIATWELISKKLLCHPVPFYYEQEEILKILNLIEHREKTKPISIEENIDYESFINKLFLNAIKRNASDIHIESSENELFIRFRIDGILYKIKQFSKKHHLPLVENIKKIARMQPGASHFPQSGKLILKIQDIRYQLNIITFPSINGESISIKIINLNDFLKDLSEIGLQHENYIELKVALSNPGFIVVSGPLMNGTITTEYAIIKHLAESNKKVFTLEAPIYQRIENIHQAEINPSAGFDYLSGLNTIIQSDPDAIYISDVPNAEVAIQSMKIASKALIIADMNANSSSQVITIFRQMGVPNTLLASSISMIINQKLVRKICDKCKEEYPIQPELLKHMGFSKKEASELKAFHGKGCNDCNLLGYKGRIALFEVLKPSNKIKTMILQNEPEDEIIKQAQREGFQLLRNDCIEKIKLGLTTIEEFQRIKL